MSNYRKGRSLEYEIRDLFERNGWSVIRGSSSKGKWADMKPDLIASRERGRIKKIALIKLALALYMADEEVVMVEQVAVQSKRKGGRRGGDDDREGVEGVRSAVTG